MSTITVARKGDQVAIAADSMTSGGNYQGMYANHIVNHQKLFQVQDSWLAIAGPSSAKFALKCYFADSEEPPVLDSVEGIYRSWLKLHQGLKDEFFLTGSDDSDASFESSAIDVLIANPSGIYGVARHRHVTEFSQFFAYGTGDEYALGAMFVAYEDETKTAEDVARIGVEAAIQFSSNSGGPVYSQTIQLKS